MVKLCEKCGKQFDTNRFKARFCSYSCYWNWLIGRKYKIKNNVCIWCGKEFITNKYIQKKFCSFDCYWKSMKGKRFKRKERIKKTCLICGEIFEVLPCHKNRKYCSINCSSKRPSSSRGKRCPQISKGLMGKKHTLSHRLNNSKAHIKNNFSNLIRIFRGNISYIEWRKAVFERDKFSCQECGTRSGNGKSVYLEAHHKKSFRTILKEMEEKLKRELTLKDLILSKELLDVDNGQTLCKKCHKH